MFEPGILEEPLSVSGIEVSGLRRTREYVVREIVEKRVLRTAPLKDVLVKVDEATKVLRSLEIFESVGATLKENGVVAIHVKEKQLGSLKIGAQTETEDVKFEASASARSFGGHGEIASLSYVASRRGTSEIQGSLSKKQFLGINADVRMDAESKEFEAPYAPSTWTSRGLTHRVDALRWRFFAPVDAATLDLAVVQRRDEVVGASKKVSAAVSRKFLDTRDSAVAPTTGAMAAGNFEVAGFGGLAGDAHFVKLSGSVQQHHRLLKVPNGQHIALSLAARGGLLVDDGGVHFPADRFYLGGSQDIRGFDVAGVGPRHQPTPVSSSPPQEQKKTFLSTLASKAVKPFFFAKTPVPTQKNSAVATGGTAFLTATALLSAPLVYKPKEANDENFRGHVFCSAACLLPENSFHSILPYTRATAGAGISFAPQNILRIEIHYTSTILNLQPFDLPKRFHFSVSGGFG